MSNLLIPVAVVAAIVVLFGLYRGWFKPILTGKPTSKRSVALDRNRTDLLRTRADAKAISDEQKRPR